MRHVMESVTHRVLEHTKIREFVKLCFSGSQLGEIFSSIGYLGLSNLRKG